MRSFWRGSALALIAAGFCLALGDPAQAGCVEPVGHRRRVRQGDSGQSRATRACRLRQAVQGGKENPCCHSERQARVAATLLAHSISESMLCFNIWCGIYKPDIVNKSSYTVCWSGVISP